MDTVRWDVVEAASYEEQFNTSHLIFNSDRKIHDRSKTTAIYGLSLQGELFVTNSGVAITFLNIKVWVSFHLYRSSFSSTKYTNYGANLPPESFHETAPWSFAHNQK